MSVEGGKYLAWPPHDIQSAGIAPALVMESVGSQGDLVAICGRVNETVADVVHRSTRRNTTFDHRVPYGALPAR